LNRITPIEKLFIKRPEFLVGESKISAMRQERKSIIFSKDLMDF
jgi:hypothetical protein